MNEIQEQIAALVQPRANVVTAIVAASAMAFGISADSIMAKDKHKAVAEARAVACFVARRCTRMSFPEIGRALGGRDHTTVMSAVKRVEALRASDEWLAAAVSVLVERFGAIGDLAESVTDLRTNASATSQRLDSTVGASLQPESETVSPLLIQPKAQKQSLAGREALVPPWGPAARCRQPSERSGARSAAHSWLTETPRESIGESERLSTELLFTQGSTRNE